MKVRVKKLPRSEKTVRKGETGPWSWELCQRPSGTYVLYAVETDGENWRIESADTIKGCFAALSVADAEIEELMSAAE